MPAGVASFITEFRNGVAAEVRGDDEFAYRLLLLPMKGPETDADMALNFVRQDDLSEAELKGLLGSQGSVIIAEKYREAAHGDDMLPKAAAAAVQARIPFAFGVNDFTRLRKAWQIGPPRPALDNRTNRVPYTERSRSTSSGCFNCRITVATASRSSPRSTAS